MKQTPEDKKLEALLRSSKLGMGGFMGEDKRSAYDIIQADAVELARLGKSAGEVAARMREITDLARAALEDSVTIDGLIEAEAIEVKGNIPCPWPHPGRFDKVVVTVRRKGSEKALRWSELSIHMIEAHGFFEGRGSMFRLDPRELVETIFVQPEEA